MPSQLHVLFARIRGFFRPGELDREFDEEIESHLALAEADKIRQGMAPAEARRRARAELGGVTQLREATREARGLPWIDTFWLDIKLGLRMLRKSWGLTLIGGLAMTIVFVIGVLVFTFFDLAFGGRLPLDEGQRVVALQTWDDKTQRRLETSSLDLDRWRESLRSMVDIGAFKTVERNLVVEGGSSKSVDGLAESVLVAEITASGFQLARVPPVLGRVLIEDDEHAGAAPVAVIGHDVWQSRFAGDPAVVGRTIRLSNVVHTVVGVMPEGFAFPIRHHFWTPLRTNRAGNLPAPPEGSVFARLAPGITLEGAQSELATLGLLPSSSPSAETDQDRRARAVPYTFAFTGDFDRGQVRWVVRLVVALVILLLVPPCANIAILVYARTITRQEEFAARYALGAGRGRIVSQLFVEILVLAAGAAAVALVVIEVGLGWAETNLLTEASSKLPFWMQLGLTFRSALFAAGLAVVAAIIAGLVPALNATGRQMRSGLHALGSRTGMGLGRTWTALVVTQVALSVAALPATVELGWGTIRHGILGPGFASEQYLTAMLTLDGELPDNTVAEQGAHSSVSFFDDLVRQLEAEPGVLGVTVAGVPGDEPWKRIEVAQAPLGAGGADEGSEQEILPTRRSVRVNSVDDAFFEVFDIPLLAGRGFEAGDFDLGRTTVMVNRTFAEQLWGDENPLGRRIRIVDSEEDATDVPAAQTWLEVVGVVADRPANVDHGTMYRPAAVGQIQPATLAVRVQADPASMAEPLRKIATALDPTARLREVATLDEVYRAQQVGNNAGAFSLAAVTLSVLLLSAAGMYAFMSFTVNQRRREIGIRSALGAQPGRLLAGIFRRAFGQLALGTAIGVLVALLLDYYLPAENVGGWSVTGIIPAATGFMMLVGLLATAGPARRGLRVEPIEELREG